jgi:hypothetical protein
MLSSIQEQGVGLMRKIRTQQMVTGIYFLHCKPCAEDSGEENPHVGLYAGDVYFCCFAGFICSPQHMMSQKSTQPQTSSTVTISPHTLHEYRLPALSSFCFPGAFFLAVFLAFFFALTFLTLFFAVAFLVAIFTSILNIEFYIKSLSGFSSMDNRLFFL